MRLGGWGIGNSVIGPRGFASDDDVWAGPQRPDSSWAMKGRMDEAH
jgi:hypothetical protein